MRGKNRRPRKFVKAPTFKARPKVVVTTKNFKTTKPRRPVRKFVPPKPKPKAKPKPKPKAKPKAKPKPWHSLVIVREKKKSLRKRKRKLKRKRPSLRKLIKRTPLIAYIIKRFCQLQYLRAYSYRTSRLRFARWPVQVTKKTWGFLANAISERRHATSVGENLFMGLNPVWVAKMMEFWIPRPPFVRPLPSPRRFVLKYTYKRLKRLKKLKELSKDKSFLFTNFKGKTVYVPSSRVLSRNFLFWFKRRRRCRVFVPLKNCLGFRRGGLLLLSRQFRLGTLFINYLTLETKYITYTNIIRKFKIARLNCFFRAMFHRNKKKTLFKKGVKKKRMGKPFRKLSLFFTTEIFHLFKLQHGLVRTKLYHYKILKESDIAEAFRASFNKRFLAFWSICSPEGYFRQLTFIRASFKKLWRQERRMLLDRKIRTWRKNNLAFVLCRRLVKLLTKRGGRLRAYRSLENLLYALKPSRRQLFLLKRTKITKKRRVKSPVLLALRKLRTYFFLRKFTKSRKTLLIPGILPKRRRLRVAARWLVAAAKKGAERTLRDRLFAAITQASTGRGSAKQMQTAFNKMVKVSKVNLRAYNRRRRRRFFVRRPRPKLKSWKDIFRTLKRTGRSKKLIRYFQLRKLRRLWWRRKRWGNRSLSKRQQRLLESTTTGNTNKFELKKKRHYRKRKRKRIIRR